MVCPNRDKQPWTLQTKVQFTESAIATATAARWPHQCPHLPPPRAGAASTDAVASAFAALTVDPKSAPCAHCGTTPAQMGREMLPLRCGKCLTEECTVVPMYCSRECNKAHWKKGHKRWHEERREQVVGQEDGFDREAEAKKVAAEEKKAEEKGDEYRVHLARGNRLHVEGEYRLGAREYQECIKMKPKEPEAYCNLGNTHHASTENLLACDAYLAAMKLYPEGSKDWAQAAERAYNSRALAIQYTARSAPK